MFIVACVGVLTASARSLPGDALYSLKQAETQFTLTFAGAPQNRATLQIDHLRSALVDLNTVVNEGRDDDAIRLALDTVAAKTSDSQEAVAALPVDSEREAAQQDLDSAIAQEEQILRQLLNNVDWPVRLAFTQQLGALGDPVPTVTNVVVRHSKQWNASDHPHWFTLCASSPANDRRATNWNGEPKHPDATGSCLQQHSVVTWCIRYWCTQS